MSVLQAETVASKPVRVAIFMNRSNQAVRIPREMSYDGASELEVRRVGDVIMMRPVRPSWQSFFDLPAADDGFMAERPDVIESRPASFADAGDET